MYDEIDDRWSGGSSFGRKLALVIGLLAVAAAAYFALRAVTNDDDGTVSPSTGSTETTAGAGEASTPPTASGEGGADDPGGASTTEGDDATTDGADATTPDDTSTDDDDTSTTTGSAGRTTTTTGAEASTTTAAPAPTAPPTYPTRLDGTPEWATVIYDVNSITLKGVVPDEAARAQFQTLAEQFARSPEQRTTVNNQMTLNPAMPRDLGVRVVELTSTRFPEGSDEIGIEHAAELNRVVAAMSALPNTTALIVGHADQQGDEVVNYVLSRDRANAVLLYMIGQGVAPERLSATAVGEEELLSLDDDAAALALNRRTEFVLFNLLGA